MSFKSDYLAGKCGLGDIIPYIAAWASDPSAGGTVHEALGLTREEYDSWKDDEDYTALWAAIMKGQKGQRYRLYQLRVEDRRAQGFMFLPFSSMVSQGYQEPPAELYDLVYEGELRCPEETSDLEMAERLFSRFNVDHPEDYKARSMSVSDILEFVDDGGDSRAYYIEMLGQNHPVSFDGSKAGRSKA